MILAVSETAALVAHRGGLALVDEKLATPRTYRVGTSSLIRFVAGCDGVFALKHHEFAEPPVRAITAHIASSPAQPVARLEIDDEWEVKGSGDADVWSKLPRLYSLVYPYLLQLSATEARIVKLPGMPGHPEDPDDPYKLVPLPDGTRAIVTSTRAGGRFVVYDLDAGAICADALLGWGPPVFRFRDSGRELWLAHSDTIFRLDTETWTQIDAARLTDRVGDSVISDMAFDPTEQRCAVAWSNRRPVPLMQPYRMAPVEGQVLVFDTDEFEVTCAAQTDRWIDELAFASDHRIVARERGNELNVRWLTLEEAIHKTYPAREPDDPTWG